MELIKIKGHEPGIRLRTDNSEPATNLAIAGVGISIIRSLWIIAEAAANPPHPIDYLFDYAPLPDDLFDKSKRPPPSIVRILRAPVRKERDQPGAKTKGGPRQTNSSNLLYHIQNILSHNQISKNCILVIL